MNTITAVLEPDSDGTLRLPLPEELRHGKVRVVATLESEPERPTLPSPETGLAALQRLRARGTFREITDPVAWQREIRHERALPGREE